MSPYSFLFCSQYEKTISYSSLNYQTLKMKQKHSKCYVCKFCALIGCQFEHKSHTKCAKLVDEKMDQLFCCLTNSEKMFDRKV